MSTFALHLGLFITIFYAIIGVTKESKGGDNDGEEKSGTYDGLVP